MVPELPIHIERGASFDHTFQWLGGGKFIGAIEDLEPGYPTRIKVTNHGLNQLSPTPVIISGVNAYSEDLLPREIRNLNSINTGIDLGTYESANWFQMPVSTVGETWFPGTGEITYFRPTDISGWGGECNIRKNWHTPVLHTISTQLGTMILTGTDGSIRLQIASNITNNLGLDLGEGVFDIDLWSGGGPRPTNGAYIERVIKGPVYFHRDS